MCIRDSLQSLKQPDIPAKYGVHRRLSTFSRPDGLIQLELQLRVLEHGDLAGELSLIHIS